MDSKKESRMANVMKIGVRGEINVKVIGADGKVKEVRKIKNLITNAGLAAMAALVLNDVVEDDFDYIAVGIGTTAANVTDTTLETEIADSGLSRVASTGSRSTTTVTNDTAELTTTFSVTGTKAVTEAGILNAGAAGDLLAHQVFGAINVVSGDTIQITWKIVFTAA